MADIDVQTAIEEAAWWQGILSTRQPYTDPDVRNSYYTDINALLDWLGRMTGEKPEFNPTPADPDVSGELARAKYRIEGLETDIEEAHEWAKGGHERLFQAQERISDLERDLANAQATAANLEKELRVSEEMRADLQRYRLNDLNKIVSLNERSEQAEEQLDAVLRQTENASRASRANIANVKEHLRRTLKKITDLERGHKEDLKLLARQQECLRQAEKGTLYDQRTIDNLNEHLTQAQKRIAVLLEMVLEEEPRE